MMLESHWANIIQKAENFALKGNIKGVKSVLSGYMQVSSRKDKIGDLLRVSFHVKITELIHEKSAKSAESFIYSYIDIFGMDSEIISVMKEYEGYFLSKLAITQDKKIPRDNWLNYENIIN
jgi:DNA-binding FadR family transcriptional regulator